MRAFQCDLTGEVAMEQRGEVAVQVDERTQLLVYVRTRRDKNAGYEEGHVSEAAAKAVHEAVAGAAAKLRGKGK